MQHRLQKHMGQSELEKNVDLEAARLKKNKPHLSTEKGV
jgi:hypothetical protein